MVRKAAIDGVQSTPGLGCRHGRIVTFCTAIADRTSSSPELAGGRETPRLWAQMARFWTGGFKWRGQDANYPRKMRGKRGFRPKAAQNPTQFVQKTVRMTPVWRRLLTPGPACPRRSRRASWRWSGRPAARAESYLGRSRYSRKGISRPTSPSDFRGSGQPPGTLAAEPCCRSETPKCASFGVIPCAGRKI